jgi:hypothetical protein
MSKRAEEAALKAYPEKDALNKKATGHYDPNYPRRKAHQQGYEQAEKDILSLIESRLSELLGDAQPTPILRYELMDLVEKIKED